MAQTNYTPISLYYSTTASAVPTAANLVPGELAINTNDGKLYYEDSSGVVQVLATKSTGSIGGSNTQVQFNNSGSLGGSSSFTWDGTTVTATKFAGALNGTVGATTASTGAFTTLSTSSTTTFSGLTASTALALDASKNVVSVTNTGTGNNVLSASPTLTGTIAGASLSLSSLTSGRVTYAGASGLLSDSANLVWDNTNARLGVGVSPSYPLSVQTSTTANNRVTGNFYNTGATGTNPFDNWLLRIASNGSGADCSINFTDSVTWNAYIGMKSGALNFAPNTGTTAMTINAIGLVGIGTTSPSWPLDVQKSSDGIVGYFRRVGATVNPALYITANETGNTVGFGTDYAGATSPAMTFTTGGTERMRITSGGNVEVGGVFTLYPAGGAAGVTGPMLYNTSANSMGLVSSGTQAITFGQNNSEKMRIDSSGNLLVGTTSQYGSGKVSIPYSDTGFGIAMQSTTASAVNYAIEFKNSSGSGVGYIAASTTTTTYSITSDQRLKENIVDAPSGNIDAIKVRSFDWIVDGSHQEYGMVAQELIEVAPYAVNKPENPDEMMAVDYSKLVPMMIKEIQDLKAEVNQLKAKIGV